MPTQSEAKDITDFCGKLNQCGLTAKQLDESMRRLAECVEKAGPFTWIMYIQYVEKHYADYTFQQIFELLMLTKTWPNRIIVIRALAKWIYLNLTGTSWRCND